MKTNRLGLTSLQVSPLCFGTLTIGPSQKNFPVAQGAELICRAYELGVNFFDTAEIYGTYPVLGRALARYPELIIASKSYAVTASEMERSLDLARKELNRDYLDLFCLHEVENAFTLKGHSGALEYLYKAKASGIIRAVGISTHTIAGVRAGATEPGIDVIHPLINRDGIGIKDGSVLEMVEALRTAKEFGKGIYGMKVLAGGHLIKEAASAIRYVIGLGLVDSVAIGMQSVAELKLNQAIISGAEPGEWATEVGQIERSLQIADWCLGCGRCVAKCSFGALSLVDGKIQINKEQCMLCGYCARVCPEFCIKVV